MQSSAQTYRFLQNSISLWFTGVHQPPSIPIWANCAPQEKKTTNDQLLNSLSPVLFNLSVATIMKTKTQHPCQNDSAHNDCKPPHWMYSNLSLQQGPHFPPGPSPYTSEEHIPGGTNAGCIRATGQKNIVESRYWDIEMPHCIQLGSKSLSKCLSIEYSYLYSHLILCHIIALHSSLVLMSMCHVISHVLAADNIPNWSHYPSVCALHLHLFFYLAPATA